MVDFFNEVEEELRADRWRTLIKKYAPAGAAAIAAIVIGVGGWLGWHAWQTNAAAKGSEAFDRGAKALEARDTATAGKAFADAAKSGTSAYKALALMAQAGLVLNDNQTDKAIALLDQASHVTGDPILADNARLKAAYLVMDKTPFSFTEVKKRLDPLMKDGRPYAAYAREALAMAKIQNGQAKEARSDFVHLSTSLDANVGQELHGRAQEAIKLIDSGQAAQMPAIAKAAAQAAAQSSAGPSPFAHSAGSPAPQAGAARQ